MSKPLSTLAQTGAATLGDSGQAFIDCILLYAKNLEADAVSHELQVNPLAS